MIQDCLEIFKKEYERYGERLVLDNYLPKDGTYVIVEMGESGFTVAEQLDIRFDKKSGAITGQESTFFDKIKFLDYCSKLIEMNKPIDSGKIIHTNNYLSFGFKKDSLSDGKLKDEIIDGYYKILAQPQLKYGKKSVRTLYEEVENGIGTPDGVLIEQIRLWTMQMIHKLSVDSTAEGELREPIDRNSKDYLKLFFVYSDWRENWKRTQDIYRQENERYLIPNIYNNNEFNVKVNGQIFGLPNDNVSLNAKKPFLANQSRKVTVPYLLNREDVILQGKFYDYLMGVASVGNVHVYFDTDSNKIFSGKVGTGPEAKMNGYFLRVKKGKEVEIHNADTVVDYNPNLNPPFLFKRIIEPPDENDYGMISNRFVLERVIDEVFFGRLLKGNYFTKPEDLKTPDSTVQYNLLMARDRIHAWVYKDSGLPILPILEQVSANLIRNSITKGYGKKALHQLNLRWSCIDYFSQSAEMEETMERVVESLKEHLDRKEHWDFEEGCDEEYYYAVGQLVYYFLLKSRAKDRPLSFVNAFLNARNDEEIKERLRTLFKKYNYSIPDYSIRLQALYSAVKRYKPVTDLRTAHNLDMLEAGFTGYNFIFKKKETDISADGTEEEKA